jgi:hypothetical protein
MPEPSTLPISFQDKEARLRRWPTAGRNAVPRLVSFGTRTVYEKVGHGRPDQPVEVESAAEADNMTSVWFRYGKDEPWRRSDVSDQPTTKVLEQFTVPANPAPKGGGRPDEITRFPPLTEAERLVGQVMRGVTGRRS